MRRSRRAHNAAVHSRAQPRETAVRRADSALPEGKVVKNRLHLDVRVGTGLAGEQRLAALEAECARLVALGAGRVRLLPADGDNESCLVMQDIEATSSVSTGVAANVNMSPDFPRHHRSTSPDRAEVLMVGRVADSPPSATRVETFASNSLCASVLDVETSS
jgi:hypothetical protein